ncbi:MULTISPECIES: Stf0 family sulfotransferase [unclassified Sinorhizobium]|uniref:Stf0 family sulfotransferase n=1 Tax=unclassified Sinorhizobium TaxID=2613772 RepID=UPI0024C2AB66|nr:MULTISPECIES: Stf0 family sulfotransferase [unclassified Sinorhizobium]MDK1373343.1 Stf0 family sulfotransferase [Sinorhizobium sp. 6-70]MDK1482220.1 Stf0 family sulfotransferase [Sinorhizobium sp. 6-117]
MRGEELRGYLLLTEGRSGSSWLGSLTDSTGVMGRSNEWLSPRILGSSMKAKSKIEYADAVIKAASTENGRFAIKIFPRHLFAFAERYGDDFVNVCRVEHDVSVFHLERRDSMRQAVSLLRGRQTKQWHSGRPSEGKAEYDFDELARCFFYIKESNSFWRSYLELSPDLQHQTFIYEEVVGDASPFMSAVARQLEVELPEYSSSYQIQRDAITEEWITRFQHDLLTKSPLMSYDRRKEFRPALKNVVRLLRKRLRGDHPFSFT